MNAAALYAMEQFFGGNFHPDWDLDAADWHQIVDSFVVGEEPHQLHSLAQSIDEFRQSATEVELHTAMLKMGGFYDPRPEMTYREWLGQVADRLRQHATRSESETTV